MGWREDPTLVAARAALRERQSAQQKALTGYFGCRSRRSALEKALAELAAEELRTLGELVACTDADTAAALTGCSVHHAREAFTAHRRCRPAQGERPTGWGDVDRAASVDSAGDR